LAFFKIKRRSNARNITMKRQETQSDSQVYCSEADLIKVSLPFEIKELNHGLIILLNGK
jgi:hypothetical protein